MNSQIVAISQAIKSKNTFILLAIFVAISLYLKAGFVSVSVIWFFTLCAYNSNLFVKDQFKRDQLKTYYFLLFPIFLFVLTIIRTLFSIDLAQISHIVFVDIHLFAIPLAFVLANKKISERDLHIILLVFVACCILSSIVCFTYAFYNVIRFKSLLYQVNDQNFYYFTYSKLTAPVDIPPVYLSMYSNLAFLAILKTPLIKNQIIKGITAGYIAIFICLIASTTGIVSLVLLTVLWLFTTNYKKLFSYILISLVAIILTACIYKFSSLTAFAKDLFKADYSEQAGDLVKTLPSRIAIWNCAWETITEKPIFGYGLIDAQKALEQTYKKNGFTWGIRESFNPHNQFLSTLLNSGVIGFSILIAMLVLPSIQFIKSNNFLPLCFIVMLILFFFMESVLERQKGIVFFSFFYSAFIYTSKVKTNDNLNV